MIDWASLLVAAQGNPTLLDVFKLFLGIDAGDDTQDAALSRALESAGAAIETHLDRKIAQREVTEDFSGYFGTVTLQHYPFVSGSLTATLNGAETTAYETYTSGSVTYVTRIGHGRDVPIDWRAFDQVTLTYQAGYDPLPNDLANAICYTAQGLFAAEGTGQAPGGAGDVSRMTIHDVGSISYNTGSDYSDYMAGFGIVPPVAAEMLVPYRKVSA